MAWMGAAVFAALLTRASAFHIPIGKIGLDTATAGAPRCQGVAKLAASPMDKFMSGLADMMSGPTPEEDVDADIAGGQQGLAESRDMNSFRRDLIKQTSSKKKQELSGYDIFDLIVDKFDVPYDVQINKTVFAGKPVLCFNVMWKYLGQNSFPLSEQEYLEHLQALAELLVEWDRVDHFKAVLAETKKRPNPYFGYAVALPLDLAPDTLAGYFDDSYF